VKLKVIAAPANNTIHNTLGTMPIANRSRARRACVVALG